MIIKTLSLKKTFVGIEHILELGVNGEKIQIKRIGTVSETKKEEIVKKGVTHTLFPKNNFTFFDYLIIVHYLGDSLPSPSLLISSGLDQNMISTYQILTKSMFKL